MHLGILTDPLKDPFSQIRWAAKHEFDYVDLQIAAPAAALETTDWKAIGQAAAEAGLDLICYAGSDFVINNPSPAIRQAALNELRRCVDAAQIVGASLLTTRFLGWPPYLDEATGYEYYRQLYEVLLAHGKERGVADRAGEQRAEFPPTQMVSGDLLSFARIETALQHRQRQRRNPPKHDPRLSLRPGRSPGPDPHQRQRRQPP